MKGCVSCEIECFHIGSGLSHTNGEPTELGVSTGRLKSVLDRKLRVDRRISNLMLSGKERFRTRRINLTIEHTCTQVVYKPWGSTDLRPWSDFQCDGKAVGELWFERCSKASPRPALLLKVLFTTEALSIQVHPDDAFAQSIGLANGKTEAWYILSATPGAKVAIGLKNRLTAPQLRASIEDGSIVELIRWLPAKKDDVLFVPAGTIHAIGPGLVIVEIQQRSDATFRLFDYGRQRELHAGNAVAAAYAGPAECQFISRRLTDARTMLAASSHFVLERVDLLSKSNWEFRAGHETWLFVLEGHARFGRINAFAGEAMFLDGEYTAIEVGAGGLKGLLAYVPSEPIPAFCQVVKGVSGASDIPFSHTTAPSFTTQ